MEVKSILAMLKNVRQSSDGNGWTALCPGHEDTENSLSIGEGENGKVLAYCHAGCSFEHIIKSLGLPASESRPQEQITVLDLSNAKKIPIEFLLSWGLKDIPGGGVVIPYYDSQGREVKRRLRFSTRPGKGFRWANSGRGIVPYGLNMTANGGDILYIVEGESDCWTLWMHGYKAIGIPGATMFKCLELGHVENFSEVIIVEEPDHAGEKFADGVFTRLFEIGYPGTIRRLKMTEAKDPNDLFQKSENFIEDLERHFARSTVKTIEKSPEKNEDDIPDWSYASSPLGIAEIFYQENSDSCVFDIDAQDWYIFNGTTWSLDRGGNVPLRISNICRRLYQSAPTIRGQKDRGALQLLKSSYRSDADRTARLIPELQVSTTDFDKLRHVICFPGGAINLKTGEVFKPSRADMFSRMAGVEYDPTATAPRWEKFLRQIWALPDKKEEDDFIRYMKRAIGYCATGETKEQVIFILHGSNGSNGKSTFMGAISSVMGGYFQTMGSASLSTKSENSVRDDLADYPGARIVATSEPEQGMKLNAEFVKLITGEDRIRCRHLYGRYFEYIPNFKLVIVCNHPPRAQSGGDSALWRRIRLVPFEHQFTPGKEDLREALAQEKKGIFKWIIEGAMEWYREGLGTCSKVETAKENVRLNLDSFHLFSSEVCVVGEQYETPLEWMTEAWNDWAENEKADSKPIINASMSRMLSRKGYMVYRVNRNGGRMRVVRGITLKSRSEECVMRNYFDLMKVFTSELQSQGDQGAWD